MSINEKWERSDHFDSYDSNWTPLSSIVRFGSTSFEFEWRLGGGCECFPPPKSPSPSFFSLCNSPGDELRRSGVGWCWIGWLGIARVLFLV